MGMKTKIVHKNKWEDITQECVISIMAKKQNN